jgi:thiol-disulfide isomerase/thioredoxin
MLLVRESREFGIKGSAIRSMLMWPIRGGFVLLSGLILSMLWGCGERSAPSEADQRPRVELRRLSLAEWEKALAQYRGKYVVVDTWATWCVPCREEFPKLVALHRKYRDRGVVVMSVSIDEPKDEPRALEFLRKQEADFPNFLLPYDDWTERWQIKGIPIVLVFDTEGKLLRRFDRDDPDKQFKYEDVDRYLADLVKR